MQDSKTLTTIQNNTTTTTFPPPIYIDNTNLIDSMDLAVRYPRIYDFLLKFARPAINIDRYMTAAWLPVSFLGCFLAFCVFVSMLKDDETETREIRINPNGNYSAINNSLRSQPIKRRYTSFNIYMASLALCIILLNFFIVLIDLDEAWNTSILARSHFACVIVRVMATTFFICTPLIILLQGLHVLLLIKDYAKCSKGFLKILLNKVILVQKTNVYDIKRAEQFKSLKLIGCLSLICFFFGLVEFAFWNINYLQIDDHFMESYESSGDSEFNQGYRVPYCDVSTTPSSLSRILPKFDDQILINNNQNISHAAIRIKKMAIERTSHYLKYNWIKICLIMGPTAIANIFVGILILKVKLLKTPTINEGLANWDYYCPYRREYQSGEEIITKSSSYPQMADRKDAKLAISLCLSFGLACLPLFILTVLSPLAHPLGSRFTDKEIERDPVWRQFFLMTVAVYFANEFCLLPSSLFFIFCYLLNHRFQKEFHRLLGCPWLISVQKCSLSKFWRRLRQQMTILPRSQQEKKFPKLPMHGQQCQQCSTLSTVYHPSSYQYDHGHMKLSQSNVDLHRQRRYSEEILSPFRSQYYDTNMRMCQNTSVSLNRLDCFNNNCNQTYQTLQHSYV